MTSTISALYKGKPIVLWVEDETTRAYLNEVWNDRATFRLLIGGGHATLAGTAEDAYRGGNLHVFALRDRDHGASNRERWTKWSAEPRAFAGDRVYVTGVQEIENHLLDPMALAGSRVSPAGRSPDEVDAELRRLAAELLWWVALRRVLSRIRAAATRGFPSTPRHGRIRDRATALAALTSSTWFSSSLAELGESWTRAGIEDALDEEHVRARAELAAAAWRAEFPGKELFQAIKSFVTGGRAITAIDLARGVAAFQRENERIPAEIADLRVALRERVQGLSGLSVPVGDRAV